MRATAVFWLLLLALLTVPAAGQNTVPLPADQEKTRGYFCATTTHFQADESECNREIQEYWASIEQWWSRLSQKDAEHCAKSYQLDPSNPSDISRHLVDCVRMALGPNNQQYTPLGEVRHMLDPRQFPEPAPQNDQTASSHEPYPEQRYQAPGFEWSELWPFAIIVGVTWDIVAWLAAKPFMRWFTLQLMCVQSFGASAAFAYVYVMIFTPLGSSSSESALRTGYIFFLVVVPLIFVMLIPLIWTVMKSNQVAKAHPDWEGRAVYFALLTFFPATITVLLVSFILFMRFILIPVFEPFTGG